MTRLLVAVGVCIGLFVGLAIAPALSDMMRWAIGIAAVAIIAAGWAVSRRR